DDSAEGDMVPVGAPGRRSKIAFGPGKQPLAAIEGRRIDAGSLLAIGRERNLAAVRRPAREELIGRRGRDRFQLARLEIEGPHVVVPVPIRREGEIASVWRKMWLAV